MVPRGIYKAPTEDSEPGAPLEKEEEPVKQPINYYWNKENWLHFAPSILKQGRVTFEELEFEENAGEEPEKEALRKTLQALDPQEPPLKPLIDDRAEGLDRCWVFKLSGSKSAQTDPFSLKQVSDTTLLIRSLVWPGSSFVYKDGHSFQWYIGDGQKYSTKEFFPQFVYNIQSEPTDLPSACETSAPQKLPEETPENTEPPA